MSTSPKEQRIIIKGRVASKKNAKRLVRAKGRMFPVSSKAWMRFEKDALSQLEAQHPRGMEPPYSISYVFEMKGKGSTDLDNMIAGINDVIEKFGVIENDKHVHKIYAEKVIGADEYKTSVVIECL